MKTQPKLRVTAKLPWWFKGYIFSLAAFCCIFKTQLNQDKFERTVERNLKFKVEVY